MKRRSLALWAGAALWLTASGCQNHTVTANSPFDNPDSIPRPQNLELFPDTDGTGPVIKVQWPTDESVFGIIDGFRLERSTLGDNLGYRPITPITAETQFFDDTVEDGNTYGYRVFGVTGAGVASHAEGPAFIEVDLTPPGPPQDPAWWSPPPGVVNIFWHRPLTGEIDEFRIYRTPAFDGGVPWLPVPTSVFSEITSFTDETIPVGVPVTYLITAVNPWRIEGEFSEPVSLVFGRVPQAPTGLAASQAGSPEMPAVALEWEPPPFYTHDVYRVYRVGNFPDGSSFMEVTGTAALDSTPEFAIRYFYWVVAVNPDGKEGAPSESVEVFLTVE